MRTQVIPKLDIVDDVPTAFGEFAAAEVRSVLGSRPAGAPFRLGCSGGASGTACLAKLAAHDLAWERVACYFVDERCVAPDSPDANARALREVLGSRLDELAGFHPMSCAEGAEAYERVVRDAGGFDLVQLGFGPDGHTASLFPGSAALDAPEDRLVVTNVDPSGNNRFERLTLTYAAIALANVVVVAVVGAEKRDALARVLAGDDLPAARVRAPRVLWLADRLAAAGAGGAP